jgi:DNA-binding NarL/FixJ family response regulator
VNVLLVGPAADRARLRALLPEDLFVVGEAATRAEARADHSHAAAWLVVPARPHDDNGEPPLEELTGREREVLELIAEGFPNKRIAARLGISDQTAKFHVASICAKLRASNRTEAVRIAIRRGLVAV